MTKITSTDETWNVRCNFKALEVPLHWKKPRRIFVNLDDMFRLKRPSSFILKIFMIMDMCPQHIFQLSTKRTKRMAQICKAQPWFGKVVRFVDGKKTHACTHIILPNVWLGTPVEDQATADERILPLLECPAAVRFLSVEPMLEEIALMELPGPIDCLNGVVGQACTVDSCERVDWVIIGGKSGPKARPFHLEWARDLIAQCHDAGVAVFMKQLGSNPFLDGKAYKPGKGKRTDPVEWPEDLRVQEYPRGGRCLE